MLWWYNLHKDRQSIKHLKASTSSSHKQGGALQQVPALGATTVTDGSRKSNKGKQQNQGTKFCKSFHIYNNCSYGKKCKYRHDGTPPSSWPKNKNEVCHKHPGGTHKYVDCVHNPANANKKATPPTDAAKPVSGSTKVPGCQAAGQGQK